MWCALTLVALWQASEFFMMNGSPRILLRVVIGYLETGVLMSCLLQDIVDTKITDLATYPPKIYMNDDWLKSTLGRDYAPRPE